MQVIVGTMTARHQSGGGIADKIDPVKSAVGGIGAWVVAFLVTIILVAVAEGDGETDDLIDGGGTVFYNAMFVPLEIEGFDESINFLTEEGASEVFSLPTVVYHVIPILVLIGAGFFVAQQVNAIELVDGAAVGASIAIGFVVLSLVGTFIVSPDLGDIDLVMAIVMGIVYPAIFGGIGGAVSTQL